MEKQTDKTIEWKYLICLRFVFFFIFYKRICILELLCHHFEYLLFWTVMVFRVITILVSTWTGPKYFRIDWWKWKRGLDTSKFFVLLFPCTLFFFFFYIFKAIHLNFYKLRVESQWICNFEWHSKYSMCKQVEIWFIFLL